MELPIFVDIAGLSHLIPAGNCGGLFCLAAKHVDTVNFVIFPQIYLSLKVGMKVVFAEKISIISVSYTLL